MILKSYLECVTRGEFLIVPTIRFEANSLTPTNVIDDMIERLKTFEPGMIPVAVGGIAWMLPTTVKFENNLLVDIC